MILPSVSPPTAWTQQASALITALRSPRFFCPDQGGVMRDVAWLAGHLLQAHWGWTPQDLAAALTLMIQEGTLRLTVSVDTEGTWSVGVTCREEKP